MKNKRISVNTYFNKNKLVVFGLVVFSILGGSAQTLWAFVIQKTCQLSKGFSSTSLLNLGIFLLISFLYFELTENLQLYMRRTLLKRINTGLKTDVFHAILQKDINDFTEKSSAKYISVLNNDVTNLENQYFLTIPNILQNLFIFLGCTAALIYYNIFIALVVLLTSLLPIMLPLIVGNKISAKEKEVYNELENYNARLKDLLCGFEVIKSFNAVKQINDIFKKSTRKLEDTRYKSRKYQNPYAVLLLACTYLVIIIQLTFAAYMVYIGKVDVSAMLSMFYLVSSINNPIQEIATNFIAIKASIPNARKVEEILNSKNNVRIESLEKINSVTPITIKDLQFSYDQGHTTLHNINLSFNKNGKYAIVGNSGSGKSTLIKLIMKYYNEYEGNIYLGNQDLKNIDKESLCSNIAIIHQKVFLFEDTLKNNITMFQNYSKEDIDYAIRAAGLDEIIQDNPEGLEMMIKENGNNFSGGEQQRISIARAILKKSKVLILDEATSSLDKKLSSRINRLLLEQSDMTIINVTHKLDEETLKQYNTIIALNQGSVVETGTFDELISKKGFFYSLYTINA